MSTIFVFADNATSTLASGIVAADTALTVSSGDGAKFPSISAGHAAMVTLEDVSGNIEIVQASARTGDVLTVTRAQEGTTAIDFASGSRVEMRVTKGILDALLQKNGGDTLSGTTTVTGVIDLGSGGSIQGGEYTGPLRSAAGVTAGQITVVAGQPKSGTANIMTDSNFLSLLPSGVGVNLTGMICLWYGTSGTIPAGYQQCDGTNGTPDLRDKFVLGAGGALPSTGGSSSTTTSASDGNASATNSYTLTSTDLPAHTHKVFSRYGSINGAGGATSMYSIGHDDNGSGTDHGGTTESTGTGGAHVHTITGVTHTHTYNLPPYRALFYIMKL